MNIACIGARNLNDRALELCSLIGTEIASYKHNLHTGNAPGADHAFAYGANSIRPESVYLHQPWPDFNKSTILPANNVVNVSFGNLRFYTVIASKEHPNWKNLSQGVKKLMIRNVSIIMPPPTRFPVDLCIAFPGETLGGTGQGMRVATTRGVKIINLRDINSVKALLKIDDRNTRSTEINLLIHRIFHNDFYGESGCHDLHPVKMIPWNQVEPG